MLRKLAYFVFALSTLASGVAFGAGHRPIGLGFHHPSVPIGVRYWFNDRIAGDLGFGYTADLQTNVSFTGKTGNFQTYQVEAGVPYLLTEWDQVRVMARPGVFYTLREDLPFFVESDKVAYSTVWGGTAELEVELFVAKNLSISASTGVEYSRSTSNYLDPDFPDPDHPVKRTDSFFDTVGRNFTAVGFHIYLFGGD